jgi:hypothetical protein
MILNMDIMETDCEDKRCMELVRERAELRFEKKINWLLGKFRGFTLVILTLSHSINLKKNLVGSLKIGFTRATV